ncbi:Crp/Fnr family transcriptional regulator [Streptomyces sp. NRRL S-118]|uniref:Crp/Fnr family transcriptional regulator n=1 Tax=Streptomyces sp. NRRL S-118 TaxID=1463881 RepID=UPI0004C99F1F|nr:cyclic nucleotide-binding domain-containing protein [Streptomyces sp. NRRL S-118]
MSTLSPIRMTAALPAEHRERLMGLAREMNFTEGDRLFDEGARADRFWIVRSGTVTLDIQVPGGRAVAIDTLDHGELVGWSWLFPPYTWQLGAEAMTPLRTNEFDAVAVRTMMEADPAFGFSIGHWVGRVLATRLQAARVRLLDLYAPHGSGATP